MFNIIGDVIFQYLNVCFKQKTKQKTQNKGKFPSKLNFFIASKKKILTTNK